MLETKYRPLPMSKKKMVNGNIYLGDPPEDIVHGVERILVKT